MARERHDRNALNPDTPLTNERTTVRAEAERRAALEREQREHPNEIAGRGRDPRRLDEEPPIDADDDSERFRARENEDRSEG